MRTVLLPGEKSDRLGGLGVEKPGRSVRAGVRVPMPSQTMGSPGGDLSLLICVLSAEPVAGLSSSLRLPTATFAFLGLFSLHTELSAVQKFTAGIKPSKNGTVSR